MSKFRKYTYLTGFLTILGGVILCGTQQVLAAESAAPAYTNEQLPFDPFDTAGNPDLSTNVAVTGTQSSSMYDILDLGISDPFKVTYGIINIVLTFLGFAFLLLLTYAGILWVTARGNEEGVTKAKDLIKRAVIGLIIVLSAYGVSYLLFLTVNYYATK